jgi:nucleotide-binding universal stress UspA family protein
MEADLRKHLEELVATLADGARERVTVDVQAGFVAHALIERIAQGRYDLVVMGTHGRTGLARVALGSIAERIVRHSTCPVLTVRAPSETTSDRARPRGDLEAAT